jgi:hypothetical protein
MTHRWIWTTREHKEERGMVEGAALHLYHHYNCDLGSTQTFEQWFADRGLDMPLFTRLESALLADTLVSHATGANLNVTTSAREILTAMIRIMRTLSSYSIQFLQSINSQPLIVTDWPMPRIGKIAGSSKDHIEGIGYDLFVKDIKEKGHIRDRLEGVALDKDPDLSIRGHAHDRIEFNIDIRPSGSLRYIYQIELPNLGVLHEHYPESLLTDVTDTDTDSYLPTDGVLLSEAFTTLISPHYALDLSDDAAIIDRWNNRTPDPVSRWWLTGLSYPAVLPQDTYVDDFEMPPDPVDDRDVIISTLSYPGQQYEMTLEELTYGVLQLAHTADMLSYLSADFETISGLMAYPNMSGSLIANELNYETFAFNFQLDELGYSEDD